MKTTDESWKVSGNTGLLISFDKEYNYLEGTVTTPYGMVSVYSQGDEKSSAYTRLDIVINGRQFSRSIYRRYTQRGLVVVAGRFAEEIATTGAGSKK